MFKLSFSTDNAAFCDMDDDEERGDDAARAEIARILRHAADDIENGSRNQGGLYDANGNGVGSYIYEAS